jgi:hypothetical protein
MRYDGDRTKEASFVQSTPQKPTTPSHLALSTPVHMERDKVKADGESIAWFTRGAWVVMPERFPQLAAHRYTDLHMSVKAKDADP